MSKNTSITLGEHFDDFIAGQVKSGRFGSASAYSGLFDHPFWFKVIT